MIIPFSGPNLTPEERLYNQEHSRQRVVVEIIIGCFTNCFQRLK